MNTYLNKALLKKVTGNGDLKWRAGYKCRKGFFSYDIASPLKKPLSAFVQEEIAVYRVCYGSDRW